MSNGSVAAQATVSSSTKRYILPPIIVGIEEFEFELSDLGLYGRIHIYLSIIGTF